MITAFTILGSAFGVTAVAFYNFHHLYLGLLCAVFSIASFMVALFAHLNKSKKTKIDEINLKEFTFIDPPGYYTHPKYSYPLCPTCLIKRNLKSPVSKEGYCTVCKEPISETLVSGGDVFTIPDEHD